MHVRRRSTHHVHANQTCQRRVYLRLFVGRGLLVSQFLLQMQFDEMIQAVALASYGILDTEAGPGVIIPHNAR